MVVNLAQLAVLATAASLTTAKTTYTYENIPSTANLKWYPCDQGGALSCARLSVPLDYTKPNGVKASIPLIKIPAKVSPSSKQYKGSLLVTSAQIGNSGLVRAIQIYTTPLRNLVANWDVIGFDPRGVGKSIPAGRCSDDDQTQITSIVDAAIGNPGATNDTNYELWAYYNAYNRVCKLTIGGANQAGPHMTTAVNARDMISIVDAIQKYQNSGYSPSKSKALVNFWGLSYYGSLLGQTFAAQYPSRVGRFVMDGLNNPVDYEDLAEVEAQRDDDLILRDFFLSCYAAGPSKCAFATGTTSGDDLEAKFYALDEALELTPAMVITTEENVNGGNSLQPDYISQNYLREIVADTLGRGVSAYPALGQLLAAIRDSLAGTNGRQDIIFTNRTAPIGSLLMFRQLIETESPAYQAKSFDEKLTIDANINAVAAVRNVLCTDAREIYETAAQFNIYFRKSLDASQLYGSRQAQARLICSTWQIRPTLRYAGPWKGTTKTPMLLISNTEDPFTPYADGVRVQGNFPNSRLLVVKGVGHTSLTIQSPSSFGIFANYINNGVLPKNGTVVTDGLKPFA